MSTEKRIRLKALDLLRGSLIVLMALDHANFHIAQQHSSGEYWGGVYPSFPGPVHFLTRFVTHVCAPGFFFLLGAGMILFASSRRKQGWTEAKIALHFLLRGLVLVGIQQLINFNQIWAPPGGSAPPFYVGVLSALGVSMILSIPLLRLSPVALAFIAGGFFLGMELITPDPSMWGTNFDKIAGPLLVYGGGDAFFWVNYPLLAWVEVAVLGLLFGKLLERDQRKAFRAAAWLGLIFLAGFVFLRIGNGFGTIRPLPIDSWRGFLSVVKYPPSLAYILLTMGINLVFLGVISRKRLEKIQPGHPLLVFGRTALFSYLFHIGIYFVMGRLLTPRGSSLGLMYILWLAGLVMMYFPARWYGDYKSRQPVNSWVRLF